MFISSVNILTYVNGTYGDLTDKYLTNVLILDMFQLNILCIFICVNAKGYEYIVRNINRAEIKSISIEFIQ